MTCKHALLLIDTLPLSDDRDATLAAIDRHARDCPACRQVLVEATALDRDLIGLVEPAPPSELSATIRRRVAREAWAARASASEPAEPAAKVDSPPRVVHSRLAWAALLVGALLALGAEASRWLGDDALLLLLPPLLRSGMASLFEARQGSAGALVLAMGMALYLAGMFAVLRQKNGLGSKA
jgi:hypothetical protein